MQIIDVIFFSTKIWHQNRACFYFLLYLFVYICSFFCPQILTLPLSQILPISPLFFMEQMLNLWNNNWFLKYKTTQPLIPSSAYGWHEPLTTQAH